MSQTDGGIAQLGEHLPCKQGVIGSIPIISTKSIKLRLKCSAKNISICSWKRTETCTLKTEQWSKQEIASKQQRGNKVQTFVDFLRN